MYEYKAKLIRVVDGDTIICSVDLGFDIWKKVNVRLMGFNAPESRTRDLEEKKRGLAAKDRLIEILDSNDNKFRLKSYGVGKFGRCLGEIFVENIGDINVQQTLINEGHGVDYFGGKRK